MAQGYGSSLPDWEGFGSLSEDPTPYSSRTSEHGGISDETQRFLERASAGNQYPTPGEISLYANHTKLGAGAVRNWFNSQHTANFSNDGSYRLSERSDPTNAALLPPAGSSSVQNDLQSISSWIGDKNESSTDSGFYSNHSTGLESLAHQYHNAASQFLPQIITDPSLDIFSGQQQQPEALPAVGWNLRSAGSHDFVDSSYSLTVNDQVSYGSTKDDEPPYSTSGRSTTVSLSELLRPCTVSSEVIGSDRSRSKRTSIKSQGEDAACEQCGARFTGHYARGNRSRHIRLSHSEKPAQPSSDLVCRVCQKEFKRQDARRKHEWRKHEIDDTRPVPRRQAAGTAYKPSHAGTYETGSDHETVTCTTALPDEPVVTLQYYVPTGTHRAYDHFANAKAILDNNVYNFYCHVVILQCERIVEALRLEQSELHATFAQQLRVLQMQLALDQTRSTCFNSFADHNLVDAQDTYQDHNGEDGGLQNKRKAPISRRASKASSRSHPYSGRPTKKTADDPLVDALEQFKMPLDQELDCPIHKYNLMHGRTSPCNGCGKPYMNGVRQHLLPTYSQQHRAQLPFIQRCDKCKDDFVDARVWSLGGHWVRKQQGAGTCRARSQPQGSSLVVWARLFLKIYPEETQVPSPYRNDLRLLPATLVDLLREDLGLHQIMSTNDPRTLSAPATPQDRNVEQDNVAKPQDLHERFQLMEAELAQNATVDALVARASELLAQFMAQEFTEASHERVNIEVIKAFYTKRLNELRQSAWAQLSQAHQSSPQNTLEQASILPVGINQAQVPVFGGAGDFPNPPYQPDQFLGMVHVPESETGTRPSSQGYHPGNTSFGYPSFTTSSRTSYDFGVQDQSQQSGAHFFSSVDLDDCSPTSQSHQYLSPYDAYLLDQPGPSRLPQQLATNALMSEVDEMMTSPFETHYALSNVPVDTEEDIAFSDLD